AVVRNRSIEIRHSHGQGVGHASAPAEAHNTGLTIAHRMILQVMDRCNEILDSLLGIERVHHFLRLFCIPGMAAESRQSVGRESLEIRERETPCDIFEMRIQPLPSVDYEHTWQPACSICRTSEVASDFSVALR